MRNISDYLHQYAIESGAIEEVFENPEEAQEELIEYAIESACREIRTTLSVIGNISKAASDFDKHVTEESFESYCHQISSIIEVADIALPVKVFVPSFESAVKEDGGAKAKFSKMIEAIKKWFAEKFKFLRTLIGKLKNFLSFRKSKAAKDAADIKEKTAEMRRIGNTAVKTRSTLDETTYEPRSKKHGTVDSTDRKSMRDYVGMNEGSDSKVKEIKAVGLPASYVKNGKLDVGVIESICDGSFGSKLVLKYMAPEYLDKFSSFEEMSNDVLSNLFANIEKEYPLYPETKEWECSLADLDKIAGMVSDAISQVDIEALEKEISKIQNKINELESQGDKAQDEIKTYKTQLVCTQAVAKAAMDSVKYLGGLLDKLKRALG